MNRKLQRELYIVMHGQERSFRIKKWVLILAILGYIYMDSGWQGVRLFVVCAFFFGIVVHFYSDIKHMSGQNRGGS